MATDPLVQEWLDYYARTENVDVNKNIDYWTNAATYSAKTYGRPSDAKLSAEDRSAYEELRNIFKYYGLEELVDDINNFALQGYSSSQAALALKQTESYKKRFAGNEMLRKAGVAVLDEADYLSAESSIISVMRMYGMPDSFASRDNVAKLIGGGVAPNEVERRIKYATDFVNNTPQEVRDQYLKLYGVNTSDLAAAYLDPKLAEPVINNRIRTATISGAAVATGVEPNLAEQIGQAQPNLSYAQAQEDFARASEAAVRGGRLGQIYGDQYGIEEAQKEVFGLAGGVEATATRKKLASKERAAFSGSSGIRAGSLAQEKGGI